MAERHNPVVGQASTREADVVVLGAGPAGLATARASAAHGLRVILIDENDRVGGQIGRLPFSGPPAPIEDLDPNITFVPRRVCVGWDGERAGFLAYGPAGLERFEGRAHVVAVGAFERAYPVPGWTKPGVMTAGAAQTLLKGSGSFPYHRVVVAGTGPLLLATAAQLIESGVDVVAVVEAARPGARDLAKLPGLLHGGRILIQGARYIGAILRHRTAVHRGWAVAEVLGADRVEGARLQQIGADGEPTPGPTKHVQCDAVLLSQGFSPSTDLVAQAGADLRWKGVREAWEPIRDDCFESTVSGLFVVGDSSGVAGSEVAAVEGDLLGHVLGERLGKCPVGERPGTLRRRLSRLARFRTAMDGLYRHRPGVLDLATDDDIACRCQETTVGEIRDAVLNGVRAPQGTKLWTRAGMGLCQGRTCHHIIAALSAETDGIDRRPPTARFPIRPIPLAALATAEPFKSPSERKSS